MLNSLWIFISLRVRTNSSALVDVVAPSMRLPSNTCGLSGDLPQLAKLFGRGKENANFVLSFLIAEILMLSISYVCCIFL